MDLGLYIHIPFCEKKCYYCDFLSYVNKDERIEEYIDGLIKELSMYKEKLDNPKINTIFIGGGSPSSIEAIYIKRILTYIRNNFNVENLQELTIEINPGDLDYKKAKIYKEAGINRISLGLQTLDNKILKSIGRNHTVEDFFNSYHILKELGFNNINVDLIFGLPKQDINNIVYDLEKILELDIKHISYYGLILEPGTKMTKWYEEGKLDLPSEEEERDIYHKIIKKLRKSRFNHYEISNYSKEGYECRHNITYWEIKPYIGVGVSSHSNINNKRFWNTKGLDDYINKINNKEFPIVGEEIIDREMEIAEYSIMGIRFIKGIDKNKFKNRFGKDISSIYGDVIEKHIRDGLLKEEANYLLLTDRGIDLANLVEMDFLP